MNKEDVNAVRLVQIFEARCRLQKSSHPTEKQKREGRPRKNLETSIDETADDAPPILLYDTISLVLFKSSTLGETVTAVQHGGKP